MKGLVAISLAILVLAGVCPAVTQTVNQTVDVNVSPAMKVSVPASASLAYNGGSFLDYTGSLTVSYRVRTGTATSISSGMRFSSNFSPSNGPSVSAGDLLYTCSSATLGTACSGTVTASTSSTQTVIAIPSLACTGGGTPCSSADPNTALVQFALKNLPTYRTGTYSASVLFTFSAI